MPTASRGLAAVRNAWLKRAWRRVAALAIAALCLARAAHATSDVDLSLPLDDGWTPVHQQQNDTQRIMEIVPKGQSVQSWTQMITYLATKGLLVEPKQMFEAMRGRFAQICGELSVEPPKFYNLAGYDVALASIGCGAPTTQKEGEYTTFLIVRGKAGMYQVSRAWKGKRFKKGEQPLTQAMRKEWDEFFRKIGICVIDEKGKPVCLNLPKP